MPASTKISPRLRFLGAAGTVTGSRYLLETEARTILVDCGLYQGLKPLRLRNWHPWGQDLSRLSAVVLTHAHIDHSGYLPRLFKLGYRGVVHCTPGTEALLKMLLPDAAHLQEEEADFANRYGYSKHHPAEPLYTAVDAEGALGLLRTADYGESVDLGVGHELVFHPAGHLLGAASALIAFGDGAHRRRVLFSGDVVYVDRLLGVIPVSRTLPWLATFAEIEQRWPEDALRWRRREAGFGPGGGEPLAAFHARSVAALTQLAARHPGQAIAVVAHGGVLDGLYRAAMHLALDAPRTWQLDNASINRLLYTGEVWTVVGWNDAAHLEGRGAAGAVEA